jgi:hypothetical protein
MARGWVYVISIKAMPNLVKIGFSDRDPVNRAAELKVGTGVPFSYEVVYDALVDSPRSIEQLVHKALEEEREDKEWFRCDWAHAVSLVRQAAKESGGILCEKEHEVFKECKEQQSREEREKRSAQLRRERKEEERRRERIAQGSNEKDTAILCPECNGLVKTAGKLPPYECSRCGNRVWLSG